jgi:hypothetical protein
VWGVWYINKFVEGEETRGLTLGSDQMRKQIAWEMDGDGRLLTLCWLLWTLEQRYLSACHLCCWCTSEGEEEEEIRERERRVVGTGQCGLLCATCLSSQLGSLAFVESWDTTPPADWAWQAGWLAPWRSRLLLATKHHALAGRHSGPARPGLKSPSLSRGTAILHKLFNSSAAANSSALILYDSNISAFSFLFCNRVPHDVWMGWMAARTTA